MDYDIFAPIEDNEIESLEHQISDRGSYSSLSSTSVTDESSQESTASSLVADISNIVISDLAYVNDGRYLVRDNYFFLLHRTNKNSKYWQC